MAPTATQKMARVVGWVNPEATRNTARPARGGEEEQAQHVVQIADERRCEQQAPGCQGNDVEDQGVAALTKGETAKQQSDEHRQPYHQEHRHLELRHAGDTAEERTQHRRGNPIPPGEDVEGSRYG
jgi:hypothetical protein